MDRRSASGKIFILGYFCFDFICVFIRGLVMPKHENLGFFEIPLKNAGT